MTPDLKLKIKVLMAEATLWRKQAKDMIYLEPAQPINEDKVLSLIRASNEALVRCQIYQDLITHENSTR